MHVVIIGKKFLLFLFKNKKATNLSTWRLLIKKVAPT